MKTHIMKTNRITASPLRKSGLLNNSTIAVARGILTAVMALTLWVGATNLAHAQLNFTINATPMADALGYVTSQNYNFVYTLNTDPTTGNGPFQPGTATAGDNYHWIQEWVMDPQIWTSVAGDGLAGTWTQPSAGGAQSADPYSYLTASSSSPFLSLLGGADVSNVGLTAAGIPVEWIWFSADFTGLNFSAITGTLPDPNVYLAGYTGSYAASSSITGWINGVSGDAMLTVNSLSLDMTTAPEPSTMALLAGGFGALFFFRRRRSGTAN